MVVVGKIEEAHKNWMSVSFVQFSIDMVLYGIAGAIGTCWGGDGGGETRRGTELDECRFRSVQYRYGACTYSGKTIITELRSLPSGIFILKTETMDLGFPVVRLHGSHNQSNGHSDT